MNIKIDASYPSVQGIKEKSMNRKKDIEELKSLSKEFEAIFIGQMLKGMRDTIPKGGLIDGGFGEEIYRSFMDQEIAKTMAERNDNGISKILFEQLKGNLINLTPLNADKDI